MILNVKFSKTLQCLERLLRVPLAQAPDKPVLCPSRAIVSLVANDGYPSGPKDPVFSVKSSSGHWVPMARSNSYAVFKKHCRLIGLKPEKFGFSSFRRGSLSHGILACGNIHLLKLQGDWVSSAVNFYIALPAEARFSVTKSMLNAI